MRSDSWMTVLNARPSRTHSHNWEGVCSFLCSINLYCYFFQNSLDTQVTYNNEHDKIDYLTLWMSVTSYLVLKIWPFYRPGYWGGYLGASLPMFLCVTLCPLINYVQKTVKLLALKGLTVILFISHVTPIVDKVIFNHFLKDIKFEIFVRVIF